MNHTLPKDEIERSKNEIKYYQWVSFVLLIQALLFYMPRIFWRTVSLKAGLNISDLVFVLFINFNLCFSMNFAYENTTD